MGIAFSSSDLAPTNQALKDAVSMLRDGGHETVAQFLEGIKQEEVTIVADLKDLAAKLQASVDTVHSTVAMVLERVDGLDGAKIQMSALQLPQVTWTVTMGAKKEKTNETFDITTHIDTAPVFRTGS